MYLEVYQVLSGRSCTVLVHNISRISLGLFTALVAASFVNGSGIVLIGFHMFVFCYAIP